MVLGAKVQGAGNVLGAVCMVLVPMLVLSAPVLAHEGHTHTVMGTIAAHHDNQLDVKTTDGKIVSITLNDRTSVVRGTGKLALKDLAVGQRVVVNVGDGKTPLVAREVKLGVEPAKK